VALKNAGCKKSHAYDPLDYKVAENTVVQPDILIVCREITKPFLDFAPVLVVEILSPATALRDRHTKFGIYESEGVKYYIIVDADKKLFEVYELKEGKYLRRDIPSNEPFNFSFDQDCNVNVLLNAIWED
jgi:Uma2 family endonuclease